MAKFETESGIEIKPLYGPPPGETDPRLGFPGQFPYTRGIHEEMYRQRLWTMRQYSGFGDASASNERFRSLMDAGQTGISVAFDLPTQMGYDSDHPMARPEVGRVGVAIDTVDDLIALFDGIPLDVANPSFTINAPAPVFVAMYLIMAKRKGADMSKLRATFQNDILKEFLTRGTYIFPPAPSVKLVGDVIEHCHQTSPSIYPISICGSHLRDTGASGIEALAITLANGFAYLDEMVSRGHDAGSIASRFSFLFCSRQDPLVEAAQFRAVRRLWATILKERYGVTDERALEFRFFAGVSNQTFTRQEPLNNIVRGTLDCLGIVLGGGQAITVICYDEAYDIPTKEAQRVALRTQQIIAHETHLAATVDPLAGSYYVEAMTDETEERIVGLLDEIAEQGGIITAIESGWLQQRMYDNAYALEKQIASGEFPVVGVNLFASDDAGVEGLFPLDEDLHSVDEDVSERRAEYVAAYRETQDKAAVQRSLDDVRRAAEAEDNVVPPLEASLEVGATLGQCVSALKDVYGVYLEGGKF